VDSENKRIFIEAMFFVCLRNALKMTLSAKKNSYKNAGSFVGRPIAKFQTYVMNKDVLLNLFIQTKNWM
jgi:hypothetical protein